MNKIMSLVAALSIVMALFFQGLYFSEQVQMALILVCLLLFIVSHIRGELRIPKDPTLIYLVLLILISIGGYVFFLEKGMNIFELQKYLMFIIFYLLINQVEADQFHLYFKNAFVITVTVAAIVSVFAYMTKAFDGLDYVIDSRLSGPLQYANTMAIVFVVACLILISLEINNLIKFIGLVILMVALLLTMSRASIIIGAIVLLIYCVISKQKKATYLVLISAIVIAILIVKMTGQGAAIDRVSETNTKAGEWQIRMIYYEDALSMIKQRPQGYGPYGYYYLQRAFQKGSTYYIKYVHSSILQLTLDMGVVAGLLTIVFGLYAMFFRRYLIVRRMAIIVIIAHSLVDVDLAYSYIWLLMLGLLVSECDYYTIELRGILKTIVSLTMVIVIGLGVYFGGIAILYSQRDYKKTLAYYPAHTESIRRSLLADPIGNEDLAQKVINDKPYMIEAHEVLYEASVRRADWEEALYHAREMATLNVLNIERYEVLANALRVVGQMALSQGNDTLAVGYFEEVVNMPVYLEYLAKEKITLYNVKHIPFIGMTPKLTKECEIAQAWLDKISKNNLEAINE